MSMQSTQQSASMTPQVAMTLAAIAATAATPRPSGETLAMQQNRAFLGINEQLANSSLATGNDWSLQWLALSPDNANMAYLAKSRSANAYAVVIRGTVGNVTDLLEDLDVGTVVSFIAVGSPPSPVYVSKGAMEAYTQVMTMNTGSGTLVQALANALAKAAPNPTVYVTGHSLGGCIATMVAAGLQAQDWGSASPQFGLYTFAAPTAGGPQFAAFLDSWPWVVNERYFNAFDIVPLAWTNLDSAKSWFPSPGPAATLDVTAVISAIAGLPGPNVYAQPGTAVPLNNNPAYALHDTVLIKKSLQDFMGQRAFQHANSTYLKLLGAPDVPAGPAVTSVSPNVLVEGTPVVINGSGFTNVVGVDFGSLAGPALSIQSDTEIVADVPAGLGVVAVRVTSNLGTSAAVPFSQFAYKPPAPVMVTGISPDSGRQGASVTVAGANFGSDAKVFFGDNPSPSVQVSPPDKLIASAPAPTIGVGKPSTVNVTVLSNGYSSPSGPADEFTYKELTSEP